MDFFIGIDAADIITWIIGAVIAIWYFFKKYAWPAYIEDKRDVREFRQQAENAAFNLVLATEHNLIDDLIRTRNQQIAEIRLAVESSTEEVLVRIKELENKLTFLQAASQRQDATFAVLHVTLLGLINEQHEQGKVQSESSPPPPVSKLPNTGSNL